MPRMADRRLDGSQEVALISLSANPDMAQYFDIKRTYFDRSKYSFYCSDESARVLELDDASTNILLRNGKKKLGAVLLWDLLTVLPATLRIIRRKHKYLVFDNEHVMNPLIALIAKLAGIKSIFSIHDIEPHPGAMYYPFKIYNYIVRNFLANGFLCFSSHAAKMIGAYGPVEQVPLLGFHAKAHDIRSGKHILWFGRVEPYKGLDLLRDIFIKLRCAGNGVKLVVAGSGNDPALTDLNEIENVEIINRFLEEKELDELILDSICVVLPYKSATQSGVIIKANSLNAPVVSFDVGSLREYVQDGENGLLVQAHDLENFAKQLERMGTASQEWALKEKTKLHYQNNHSAVAVTSTYQNKISKLLEAM